jgi:hypothetical protein
METGNVNDVPPTLDQRLSAIEQAILENNRATAENGLALTLISNKLDVIRDILTPADTGDAPTLDEILGRIVILLAELRQTQIRIDRTTSATARIVAGSEELPQGQAEGQRS